MPSRRRGLWFFFVVLFKLHGIGLPAREPPEEGFGLSQVSFDLEQALGVGSLPGQAVEEGQGNVLRVAPESCQRRVGGRLFHVEVWACHNDVP